MSAVILAVELVRGLALPGALDAWAGLEAQVPDAPVACGHRWTRAFLAHFGDVVAPSIALVRDDGELVGVALVCRDVVRRGPLRVRRLHVGTAGEPPDASIWVERNGLLTLPGRRPEVARALVDALRAERDWDALELPGFLPDHAAAFATAQLPFRLRAAPCGVTDLDGELLARFSKGTRGQIRRSERRLGPARVTWAASPEEGCALLEELIALHQARWAAKGRPGAFADRRCAAFHRELLPELLGTGDAWIAGVDGPRGRLGCSFGFVEGDRMTDYQNGRIVLEDTNVSVGLLVDVAIMRAARDRGFRCYDSFAGHDEHKRRLSTADDALVWATARRGALRWAVHDAGRELRHRLRDRRRRAVSAA